MNALLIIGLFVVLAGCASLVEKCHEFSKFVDIKAIDCAEEKKDEPEKK